MCVRACALLGADQDTAELRAPLVFLGVCCFRICIPGGYLFESFLKKDLFTVSVITK